MDEKLGLLTVPHKGQKIYSELNGKKFARFPVRTRIANLDEDLYAFISEHMKEVEVGQGDFFCIASKVVSVCKGYYKNKKDIKVSWLAKFLVKYVKKWPDDHGFAVPEKIQWAIDIVGIPRFLLAVILGGFLKLMGKPGYFYRIAGHNIRSIDGFMPEEFKKQQMAKHGLQKDPEAFPGYGFIAPPDSNQIADEIETKHGYPTAILDGNNIENVILGVSKSLEQKYTKVELLEILKGNPQGQEGNTPFLLVKQIAE